MEKNDYVQFFHDKPEESVGFLFWQINSLWQQKMNKSLKELNLTLVEFILLSGVAWLERFKEPLTQIKLAKHAKKNVMMTSKVIRILETKKLIQRRTHDADTRAKCIYITSEGKEKVKIALKLVKTVDEEFFSPVVNSEEDFIKNLSIILLRNSKKN